MAIFETFTQRLSYFKSIMLRRHPSTEHRKSLEKFENSVLYYRSNILMILLIIGNGVSFLTESTPYHNSMKFLDSDKADFDVN